MSATVFGWTFEQYRIAADYASRIEGKPVSVSLSDFARASFPSADSREAADRLTGIRMLWMRRRIDNPGEIKLETAGWKPVDYSGLR